MVEEDAAVLREAILQMRMATTKVLADNPPLPFGRARRIYVWIVAPFMVFAVVVDILLGLPMTALLAGVGMGSAIALLVGSWLYAKRRREQDTIRGLWLGYARTFLKRTDRSIFEVHSLSILAEAQNAIPPLEGELAEIERQLVRATPLRAAGISAYLQLRIAANDRRMVARAARTMRNAH